MRCVLSQRKIRDNKRGRQRGVPQRRGPQRRGPQRRGPQDLSGAYLIGANLSGADLSRAYLSRANLIGAILPADMSIMQILGSRVPLVALSTPEGLEVRSGCEHHDLEWWQANGETLGRKEGYSDSQIDEYKRHFVYLTEWHAFVRSMKG